MDNLKRGVELINKLANIDAIATDVDGTITANRDGYFIPSEVIECIREIRKYNIMLIFVSANAFPVLYGLARYIGAKAIVSENGCIIASLNEHGREMNIYEICGRGYRELVSKIVSEMGDFLKESWQNDYRKYDFALIQKDNRVSHIELMQKIKKIVIKNGYDSKVNVNYSGYAFHITPKEGGKSVGLKKISEILGIELKNTLGIGDSYMDLEFIQLTGVKVAVRNADEDLKRNVDIITDEESGYGFAQICETIIDAKKIKASISLED
ncbi:phosphoglycolate phosphatase [Fervidicoccus fontis]|uniref:phosphoglycolate phosphatase n=1 Tax=Fervidicoccus fontis TaxID=683846 RepID=UPI002353243B|nr:phosphoglycolate phosphatase [Fervidicoccus fontis]